MSGSMPSPQSLLVRSAFRNLRPLRPAGKSGARKSFSVKEDQVREHLNELHTEKLCP